jgi:hypothetical protein
MLGVAALALVLATPAPLATTVLGLIGFGILHKVLEIGYVAGRFAPVLSAVRAWSSGPARTAPRAGHAAQQQSATYACP